MRTSAAVLATLLLVTMITSKLYLGWTRNTWDPIVLGVVLIGMLACMWGGFGLQAVDHFQKAIYAVDRPPNNLIRAVAWIMREVAWWFVMAVLSALLVSIYCRMPVVMRLVRLLPGRFGSP